MLWLLPYAISVVSPHSSPNASQTPSISHPLYAASHESLHPDEYTTLTPLRSMTHAHHSNSLTRRILMFTCFLFTLFLMLTNLVLVPGQHAVLSGEACLPSIIFECALRPSPMPYDLYCPDDKANGVSYLFVERIYGASSDWEARILLTV